MTQLLELPGTATNFVDTPDDAQHDITTDLQIIMRIALDAWSGAGSRDLFAKWTEAGDERSFRFRVFNSGRLLIETSTDGTGGGASSAQSSIPNAFTNGDSVWLKVTWDVNDGAGNRVAEFWYSLETLTDPTAITWIQLGITVSQVGVTTIFNGTSVLEIGGRNGGATGLWAGDAYRAQVYDGIDGTIIADFDACDFAIGDTDTDTAVDSTGLTWTIHGTAIIAGTSCDAPPARRLIRSPRYGITRMARR